MYISRKTANVEKPHIAYCLSLLHLTKPNSLPCLPGDVVCQIYSFLHGDIMKQNINETINTLFIQSIRRHLDFKSRYKLPFVGVYHLGKFTFTLHQSQFVYPFVLSCHEIKDIVDSKIKNMISVYSFLENIKFSHFCCENKGVNYREKEDDEEDDEEDGAEDGAEQALGDEVNVI